MSLSMSINFVRIISSVSKSKIAYSQTRGFRKIPEFEGGIKYHGFTYHPRFPDQKDPPYEPTKLFLVERIKPNHHINRVERAALELFDICGEKKYGGHISVVKNTPQNNAELWKIKHLIKITPIKLVNGLPKDGDLSGCWLKENGEFIVSPKLKIDVERVKSGYAFQNDPVKLDRDTMKKQLRLDWMGPFGGAVDNDW